MTKYFQNTCHPQFSIVIRNVPVDMDIDTLIESIKDDYPDVVNVHRITNKAQQQTTLVRVDINNIQCIDELLAKKFIYVNNTRFAITDYLAPAKVLVCNKCFQIGHFRSTCSSEMEFCRTCGLVVTDIKQHKETCDNVRRCSRCKGSHEANDARCPEIKSYRAVLTKSLLTSTGTATQQSTARGNVQRNDHDFPVLNSNANNNEYRSNRSPYTFSDTSRRMDELTTKMMKINENLNRLMDLNNNFGDQITNMQQVVFKHEHSIQIQQTDIVFLHSFVSQFVSPICQVMVESLTVDDTPKYNKGQNLAMSILTYLM